MAILFFLAIRGFVLKWKQERKRKGNSMKKFFKYASLICFFVAAGMLLAGCMERTLNVSDNITSSLATIDEYLATNVYGKPAQTDFNTNTSSAYVSNENYFVLVATEVTEAIPKIKLGNIVYTGGVDISIAVGNSNVITRVPYLVDTEKLFISAPLLFLNAGGDGITDVSFPDQNIMPFNITVFTGNTLTANVTSQNEGVLFAISNTQNQFNFKSNTPNNSIFVVLKNGETVLATTDIIFVEKVANAGKTNQSVAYSYVNPSTPAPETENGIQLFPGYNNGQNYTETTPPDHELTYNIYVPGVGAVTILIHFENTFA